MKLTSIETVVLWALLMALMQTGPAQADHHNLNPPFERTEVRVPCTNYEPTPGGHLKLPHSWPGQNPPPEHCGTVTVYALCARIATRAAASLSRQLLPSNLSRCE